MSTSLKCAHFAFISPHEYFRIFNDKLLKSSDPDFLPEFVCEQLSSDQLGESSVQLQLSARAYHRTLKLVRTIADLALSEISHPRHLAGCSTGRR